LAGFEALRRFFEIGSSTGLVTLEMYLASKGGGAQ